MLRIQSGSHQNLQVRVVDAQDDLYWQAVELAQEVYRSTYGAIILPRPSRFIVCVDELSGVVDACAGMTFGYVDKLFSEHYLKLPIEETLKEIFGEPVPRSQICEINALSTRHRSTGAELVRVLPLLCWFWGQRALICTVTQRLKHLIEHQKIPFASIAVVSADQAPRIEGIEWGSYYAASPETIVVKLNDIGHLFDMHCSRYRWSPPPIDTVRAPNETAVIEFMEAVAP